MLTYSNDSDLKSAFVAEVKRHSDLDHLIKGDYGDSIGPDWRGCAVGCAVVSLCAVKGIDASPGDHAVLESEGLYPEWLARLEDTIFEGLPDDKAMSWPLRLSTAIPVGVDLASVKWRFCAFLMQENIDRVSALNVSGALKGQVATAIRGVLTVHETAIATGEWNESAADAAESAADAARSAARSAADAAESAADAATDAAWSAAAAAAADAAESAESAADAARSAAADAAESAADAATDAAWSAAAAAAADAAESAESAADAARSGAYMRYADTLIELLRAAQ